LSTTVTWAAAGRGRQYDVEPDRIAGDERGGPLDRAAYHAEARSRIGRFHGGEAVSPAASV
jgi:hypothetical protein